MLKTLAAALLLAVGCIEYSPLPEHGATDFAVTDPSLAAEVEAAAADWARAGLVVASYVTVNQEPGAVPVEFIPRAQIPSKCAPREAETIDPHSIDGCTKYREKRFVALWLPDDLSPERRAAVLRHELIHVLVPDAPHAPDESTAVFHADAAAASITMGDVMHLRRYAEFEGK
jgi:hypothetical protein